MRTILYSFVLFWVVISIDSTLTNSSNVEDDFYIIKQPSEEISKKRNELINDRTINDSLKLLQNFADGVETQKSNDEANELNRFPIFADDYSPKEMTKLLESHFQTSIKIRENLVNIFIEFSKTAEYNGYDPNFLAYVNELIFAIFNRQFPTVDINQYLLHLARQQPLERSLTLLKLIEIFMPINSNNNLKSIPKNLIMFFSQDYKLFQIFINTVNKYLFEDLDFKSLESFKIHNIRTLLRYVGSQEKISSEYFSPYWYTILVGFQTNRVYPTPLLLGCLLMDIPLDLPPELLYMNHRYTYEVLSTEQLQNYNVPVDCQTYDRKGNIIFTNPMEAEKYYGTKSESIADNSKFQQSIFDMIMKLKTNGDSNANNEFNKTPYKSNDSQIKKGSKVSSDGNKDAVTTTNNGMETEFETVTDTVVSITETPSIYNNDRYELFSSPDYQNRFMNYQQYGPPGVRGLFSPGSQKKQDFADNFYATAKIEKDFNHLNKINRNNNYRDRKEFDNFPLAYDEPQLRIEEPSSTISSGDVPSTDAAISTDVASSVSAEGEASSSSVSVAAEASTEVSSESQDGKEASAEGSVSSSETDSSTEAVNQGESSTAGDASSSVSAEASSIAGNEISSTEGSISSVSSDVSSSSANVASVSETGIQSSTVNSNGEVIPTEASEDNNEIESSSISNGNSVTAGTIGQESSSSNVNEGADSESSSTVANGVGSSSGDTSAPDQTSTESVGAGKPKPPKGNHNKKPNKPGKHKGGMQKVLNKLNKLSKRLKQISKTLKQIKISSVSESSKTSNGPKQKHQKHGRRGKHQHQRKKTTKTKQRKSYDGKHDNKRKKGSRSKTQPELRKKMKKKSRSRQLKKSRSKDLNRFLPDDLDYSSEINEEDNNAFLNIYEFLKENITNSDYFLQDENEKMTEILSGISRQTNAQDVIRFLKYGVDSFKIEIPILKILDFIEDILDYEQFDTDTKIKYNNIVNYLTLNPDKAQEMVEEIEKDSENEFVSKLFHLLSDETRVPENIKKDTEFLWKKLNILPLNCKDVVIV